MAPADMHVSFFQTPTPSEKASLSTSYALIRPPSCPEWPRAALVYCGGTFLYYGNNLEATGGPEDAPGQLVYCGGTFLYYGNNPGGHRRTGGRPRPTCVLRGRISVLRK